MKRTTIFYSIVICVLFLAWPVFTQTSDSNVKEKKVLMGKEFEIQTEKILSQGNWYLNTYDKELLDLLEDRKSLTETIFVFKALQKGTAHVVLDFKINDRIIRSETYQILVSDEDSVNSVSSDRETNLLEQNSEQANLLMQENPVTLDSGNTENFASNGKQGISNPLRHYYESLKMVYDKKLFQQVSEKIKQPEFQELLNSPLALDIILIDVYTSIQKNEIDSAITSLTNYMTGNTSLSGHEKGLLQILKADIYSANKTYDKAESEYFQILVNYANDSELKSKAYLGLAKNQLKQETPNFQEAIRKLKVLVELYPDSNQAEEALFLLGQLYFTVPEIEDYYQAFLYYHKLCQQYPNGPYYQKALKNMTYLERNYLNYRE